MSTSISRGPFRKLGVRPTARSTRFTSASRRTGPPFQAIAATRFQNGGLRRESHRIRPVERRRREDRGDAGDFVERGLDVRAAVAEVGAESEKSEPRAGGAAQ